MKKQNFILTVLIGTLSIFPLISKAQYHTFKINPLSAAVRTLNLQYEHGISERQAVQLGFFYSGFGKKLSDNYFMVRSVAFTPEYRIYLNGKRRTAPAGFFIGPYARFKNTKAKENETDSFIHINTLTAGGLAGYQWRPGEHFTLELFGGLGFGGSKYSGGSESVDIDGSFFSVFSPSMSSRFGMSVGIVF